LANYSAPGKLNLYFSVGSLLENGYHQVASLYQAVNILELVSVVKSDSWEVFHTGSLSVEQLSQIPNDSRNLVVKAAQALAKRVEIENPQPLRFSIRKRVPVAGGMAGGSADAAAALLAVNEAWCLGLEKADLIAVAAELGADVPFALVGGTAIGLGTGTELTQVNSQTLSWVVVLSDQTLSTPEVFNKLDQLRIQLGQNISELAVPEVPIELVTALSITPTEVAKYLHNDLESAAVALLPELQTTLELGMRLGALRTMVSGSGPTVAMLCEHQDAAVKLASDLRQRGQNAFACSGPVSGAALLEV
jgi:4-diphosphocytidyl-2-C-methyl-D-erythritol kinase